ncbi:MAG: M23 family metallopeptidase [Acidimicrobiales bacterium]
MHRVTRDRPRTGRFPRSLAAFIAAATLMSVVIAAPQNDASATSGPEVWRAPEALGAPFRADPREFRPVLDRATALRDRQAIVAAIAELARRGSTDVATASALSAELVSLDRRISQANDTFAGSEARVLLDELGIGVAVFPVDELRKPFSNDWNEPRSGGRRHRGTDLLAQTGVPLRAVEDSTVDQISNGSLGGLSVHLIGASGARYYYAHLDEVAEIIVGDALYAGEKIGTVGDTGNARGSPHLHIQWAPDGDSGWQNPYPLLAALFGVGETPGHPLSPSIRRA